MSVALCAWPSVCAPSRKNATRVWTRFGPAPRANGRGTRCPAVKAVCFRHVGGIGLDASDQTDNRPTRFHILARPARCWTGAYLPLRESTARWLRAARARTGNMPIRTSVGARWRLAMASRLPRPTAMSRQSRLREACVLPDCCHQDAPGRVRGLSTAYGTPSASWGEIDACHTSNPIGAPTHMSDDDEDGPLEAKYGARRPGEPSRFLDAHAAFSIALGRRTLTVASEPRPEHQRRRAVGAPSGEAA